MRKAVSCTFIKKKVLYVDQLIKDKKKYININQENVMDTKYNQGKYILFNLVTNRDFKTKIIRNG